MPRAWSRKQRDLDAELEAHLTLAIADRVARGESPAEAERNARRELGDVVTIRETTSDMWSGEWWHALVQDARYAVRSLSRAPGYALVAVLTLALGIGANTAIFSVVNGVVLEPLPYPSPNQLLVFSSRFPKAGLDKFPVDAGEYFDLRDRARSLSDAGAYYVDAVNVNGSGAPQRVVAAYVTNTLFSTLGVAPEAGRTFTASEVLPNGPAVVVLSDQLWRTAFGARRSIVGQTIDVDGVQRTVLGVMPPTFDVHDDGIRIYLPIGLDPAQRNSYRGGHNFTVIGRLRPGVTLTQARTELATLVQNWAAADGATPTAQPGQPGFMHTPRPEDHPMRYDDLRGEVIGSIGRALWILQAAVVFVLLIACANTANLLLTRAESRHKEIALRAALGAGRGRLLRQWMAESLILAVIGGVLGIALAVASLRLIVAVAGTSIPRVTDVAIDGRVLAFTLAITIGTGLLFGIAPLTHLSARALGLSLREAGSRTATAGGRTRLRRALVTIEVALAVTLLVGASLFVRTFWKLMSVDAGFDRSHLTTFSLALPQARYTDSTRVAAFYDRLIADLDALPGVERAAVSWGLPPKRELNANDTNFEGYVQRPGGPIPNVDYYQATSPSYFATMRIPIVAGRAFGPQDGPSSPPVMIVNESLVKRFYPGEDPIGKRIQPARRHAVWFTIIGVARDVKQGGVDSKTGTELYFDYDQMPRYWEYTPTDMHVVVRSPRSVDALAPSIRGEVRRLDPSLPVVGLRSMDDVFSDSVSRQRLLADLLGLFTTVALVLAAIGTYGVLAYSVAERQREIGIRVALGASASRVRALVVRQGMSAAIAGVLLGLAAASVLTRLASALLFGVSPTDPLTYAAAAGIMLAVALAACLIPARRAMRVDPVVALTAE